MKPLLITIPFTAENAPVAERLCDWIFKLNGRNPKGHALLVAAHDVHAEMCAKVAIAAEVACATSELIAAPELKLVSPTAATNHLFKFAGDYILRHFRCPWLWLEPNCVPLKPGWLEQLILAYESQPKRFMGAHLKFANAAAETGEKICLARCSVYPADAINDLEPHCASNAPFNLAAAEHVLSRSIKSRLIQELAYDGDFDKVRVDACVLNGDKTGLLIEQLRTALPTGEAINIPITNSGAPKLTVAERMAKARAARRKVGAIQMARL